ncbi:hypothetical protein [Nocardiopsis baichengensis]|uniref:hypothetical protein n=1 Tax=Nocardiopsis baichengensis TaxID=280240 RepID=UPI000348FFF6|nr:hypothetical protein [Nocardiopsis baichengensis]
MSRTPQRLAAGFAVFGFAALGSALSAHAEPEPITKAFDYDCTSQQGWEESGQIEWTFGVTNGDSFDPGEQVRSLGNSQWRYAYPEGAGNVERVTVRHEVDLSGGAATDEKVTFKSRWTGSAPAEAFQEGTEEGDWQYPSQEAGTRAGDGSNLVFSGGDVVASVLFESGEHWVTSCTPAGDSEITRVAVSGKPDPEEPEDPDDGDDGDGEDPGGDDGDGGDGGDGQNPGGDDGDDGDGEDPGGDDGDGDGGDGQNPGGDQGDGDEGDKGGDKGDDKPAPGDGSAGGDDGGSLPVTGAALGGMVAAAVAAVGGGGAAMYFSRKKKAAASGDAEV